MLKINFVKFIYFIIFFVFLLFCTPVLSETVININDMYKNAVNYDNNGNYEKAKELYIKILKYRPSYLDVIVNLGNLYIKMGKLEKGHEVLSHAQNINQVNFRVNKSWIDYYMLIKKYDLALDIIDKNIKWNLHPKYFLLRKAKILDICRLEKQSIKILKELADTYPADKEINLYLKKLINNNFENKIKIDYEFFIMNDIYPYRNIISLFGNKSFKYGTISPEINVQLSKNHKSFYFKFDYAVKLVQNLYLNIKSGYNINDSFIKYNGGGGINFDINENYSIGANINYLKYDVSSFTTSEIGVTRHFFKHTIGFKIHYIPDYLGISKCWELSYRYYYDKSVSNYLEFIFGTNKIDEKYFYDNTSLDNYFNTKKIECLWLKKLNNLYYLRIGLIYNYILNTYFVSETNEFQININNESLNANCSFAYIY